MKHEALFCLQSDTWHLFTHNKKKFFQTSCCMRVSDVLSVISKGQNSCVSKRSVNHYEEHRMISITVSQMILHTYNSIWTWVTASKHLNILQYLMVSPPAGSQHIFKIIFISYHNTVIYFSVFSERLIFLILDSLILILSSTLKLTEKKGLEVLCCRLPNELELCTLKVSGQ